MATSDDSDALIHAYRAAVIDAMEKGNALLRATTSGSTAIQEAARASAAASAHRDELEQELNDLLKPRQ